MSTVRLAIVSTHPIQYNAPLFGALARSGTILPRVFYTWSQTARAAVTDVEFGRQIVWDIPLLEGYEYEFVENVARRPGTDHFFGLRNPSLLRAITDWKPQALLVVTWNSWSHLRAMAHFKGRIPVLFRGDSTLIDPRSRWRAALRRMALHLVYRNVDVALAVGANNHDYFRWCGLSERQIVLAPHAVDTMRFGADDDVHRARALAWRRDLSIPEDARVLLFAGKLIEKKAPELLLEAFLRSGADGHLVFVGDGRLEAELRARAAGRSDVHFLPFQNQQAMPAVYRLGDVLVLPSRGPGETWGLAMNEALACGCLLIASDRVGRAPRGGPFLPGTARSWLHASRPSCAVMRRCWRT